MTSFYPLIPIALVFTHSSDPFSHHQIPKFGRTMLGNSAMQHHTIARHVMTRYTTKVKSHNCFEIGFSLTSQTMLRFCLHIPRQIEDINTRELMASSRYLVWQIFLKK